MTLERNADYLISLLRELCKLPAETSWLEFKRNNADPQEIGEYLAALSNAAALDGKSNAYLVWGVDDKTHEIVGTTFVPQAAKKGNEELESWLLRLLNPRLHFRFHAFKVENKPLVLLEIPSAHSKPTSFEGRELIRIGSNEKPLKDFPEQERALWRVFDRTPFEELSAASDLDAAEALALLDYPAYFDLLGLPLPTDQAGILSRLQEDGMLRCDQAKRWEVTNLGAILFARELKKFKGLARKAVRLIVYEGKGRLKTLREQVGHKGYASGFEGLIDYLSALLPRNEVIGKALRKEVPMYPDLAVRELIANALIHQDFSVSGAGPMVEIFEDRLEITNPGEPLVDVDRFLDSPPRSRNEALASFMRRVGICEERGSGVDKVVVETEIFQLPPPRWERPDGSLRVVLFAHRALKYMDKQERAHACYLHACLRYVLRDPMTNTSLRERFGIEAKNSAMASRIIKDAREAKLIKPYEEGQANKNSRYLPYWV
ncbi:ATP-binding protein [Pseudomonas aeruginosa]|uniref:ATP-binding protein n=1 Tax=Pseudomonas aeruginosa TaxID=287 RepID=UPI000EAD8B84|nr:ATP-binding protein [Pseudomonas aeruginosa]MCO2938276.1 transcriptional regulator [Pseudomonas aeruginosa]HBN9749347.1 putative DNA binding domain-containing protein [Pseudomonas aeruginosa]